MPGIYTKNLEKLLLFLLVTVCSVYLRAEHLVVMTVECLWYSNVYIQLSFFLCTHGHLFLVVNNKPKTQVLLHDREFGYGSRGPGTPQLSEPKTNYIFTGYHSIEKGASL